MGWFDSDIEDLDGASDELEQEVDRDRLNEIRRELDTSFVRGPKVKQSSETFHAYIEARFGFHTVQYEIGKV
ncbi:MAG: hypothetical protein ABEJ07_05395, partial [Candidatus Nanohaloarchaea archaeon]